MASNKSMTSTEVLNPVTPISWQVGVQTDLSQKPLRGKLPGITFLNPSQKELAGYDNVRRQGFYQKYFVCELLKNEGNSHYTMNRYQVAIDTYAKAIAIFRVEPVKIDENAAESIAICYDVWIGWIGCQTGGMLYIESMENRSEKEKSMFKKLIHTLFRNISQCFLSLKDYQAAYLAASHALHLDSVNPKAL